MSTHVNIEALADSVLASVARSSQEKTASTEEVSHLKTEVGLALKEAAEKLRGHDGSVLTNEYIARLMSGTKMASVDSPAEFVEAAGSSELGSRLRKIAHSLRVNAATQDDANVVKSAQAITAAVGLKHLTETN